MSLLLFAAGVGGCSRTPDAEPAVATPSVSLARADAAIGTPLEMSFQFVVAPNAPALTEDYWVFVHFLDADGELMWTDDHQPPVPTREWKPGQMVTYPRTLFVPKFPYVGSTHVDVGLFSPKTGQRLPMTGTTTGQRAYTVATFNLHRQTDDLYVIFKDGWHETEVADETVGIEWQWSRRNATLAFRNPRRDIVLYLQCDQPVANQTGAPHVELRIGAGVIDSFELSPGDRELRKIPLSRAQLGDLDTVEVAITTDKTFVPAEIPALKSTDSRELGVRVFRAYVQTN